MIIYTIGHSNYSFERLVDMLKHYKINVVVDIRGTPYSKYNTQFDKEIIKYSLNKAGYIYIYMAKELAAKRINKKSYNTEGYCDFEKAIYEEDFIKGIERLRDGCKKGYNIALLGAMQDPIRCHRSILVGRSLRDNGFTVRHILDDYSFESQEDIEKHILDKYFPNRNQLTIDSLLGMEKSQEEVIKDAYRLANREIGRRVENLDK